MMPRDLETAIQQSHDAVAGIFRGDADPAKALFSDREDVTLGEEFCGEGELQVRVEDVADVEIFEKGAPAADERELRCPFNAGCRDCALVAERAADRQRVSAGARASPSWIGDRRHPTRIHC